MLKFTDKGDKVLYKIYDVLYRIFKAGIFKENREHHADKTYEVISYAFISYRALLILYKIEEINTTFEIILQNDYREEFKVYKNTGELPRTINVQQLILLHHHLAFEIK